MPKKKIRKLAERGKLRQAIDALLELSEQLEDDYVRNDASGLSGRFYGLESQKNSGLVTAEYYGMQTNNIRHALYAILDDLPALADDAYDLPSLQNTEPHAYPAPEDPGLVTEPDPAVAVTRILIFTANTGGETQLDLSDEYARIREMLDNEGLNNRCQLKRIRLVTPEAIMEEILEFEPHIVHFSGHGIRQRDANTATGPGRGFGEEEEESAHQEEEGIATAADGALIVHNGANYSSFQIGSDFLSGVFEIVKDDELPTHTVVFNACHSEAISGGVATYIENVIATNNAIGDRAAISFSSTFYSRLIANDTTPEKAFKAARVVTIAYGEPKNRFVFYHNGQKKSV